LQQKLSLNNKQLATPLAQLSTATSASHMQITSLTSAFKENLLASAKQKSGLVKSLSQSQLINKLVSATYLPTSQQQEDRQQSPSFQKIILESQNARKIPKANVKFSAPVGQNKTVRSEIPRETLRSFLIPNTGSTMPVSGHRRSNTMYW
jgi:hypothetical protein